MATSTTTIKKIALITGSTRAIRVGPAITQFIESIISADLASVSSSPETSFTLDFIDIATFKLPVFDEKVYPASVPAMAKFEGAHSIAWSVEIAKYDAYILTTPCCNAGPPRSAKNALDYLYSEIKGKPWMVVSYGVYGGSPAAKSLAASLKCVGCVVVDATPALAFAKNEPMTMGMSADVIAAGQGNLGEASLAEWANRRRRF